MSVYSYVGRNFFEMPVGRIIMYLFIFVLPTAVTVLWASVYVT